MPQIIVVADPRSQQAQHHETAVMFNERVTVQDFESEHFQSQLVERLGWAVGDADAVERSTTVEESAASETVDDRDDDPREVRASDASPSGVPAGARHRRLSAVQPVS